MGGFDERYDRPSVEDIELGYRLKRDGYHIRLCKQLQVTHGKRWGVVSLVTTDYCARALPWTELILRDRHMPNDLNLGLCGRMSVLLTGGMVGASGAAVWRPAWFTVAAVLGILLFVLNAPLYRFFQCKRGVRFALQAIPWHWLYYGYSGLAFAVGVARFFAARWRPRWLGRLAVRERCTSTMRRAEAP